MGEISVFCVHVYQVLVVPLAAFRKEASLAILEEIYDVFQTRNPLAEIQSEEASLAFLGVICYDDVFHAFCAFGDVAVVPLEACRMASSEEAYV